MKQKINFKHPSKPLLLIFLGLLLYSFSKEDNEIIELPIKIVDGFRNFIPGFRGIGQELKPDNPWYFTERDSLRGLPTDWTQIVRKSIWFDSKQFAFQSFKQGYLKESFFERLKTTWTINLLKRPFSEKPIKCFVYIIYGRDKNGKIKYKIDTNNNFDFSDELEFSLLKYEFQKMDSLAANCSHKVKYETFRNGKLVELTAPVLIVEINGTLWSSFPLHGEAELNGHKIIISSSSFNSIDFDLAEINLLTEDKITERVNENEYLKIEDNIYQNLGVNIDKQILLLKKIPKDTTIFSSQVGFYAKSFVGSEFSTREKIILEQYKGKFLYLEFWGSWCAPCVRELPLLRKTYDSLDKTKIEFLGIALDKRENLKKILEKEKIEWKQILFEDEVEIIKDYNIKGYPTSFLIDPRGKIVAKNIRGETLLDSLNSYLKKYEIIKK